MAVLNEEHPNGITFEHYSKPAPAGHGVTFLPVAVHGLDKLFCKPFGAINPDIVR